MALKQLSFSKSWTNPADFPTVETDETVIRQDMQQLHDETKAYLNGTLLPAIEGGFVPAGRTVNGHALTEDVTVTKGDVGLGQVDNTADMDKPVSTAQAAAIQAAVMGQIPAGSVEKTMLSAGVAAAVSRAEEGGGLDQKIADTASQRAALLHAAQHGASGSDPVTPAAIGAVAKTGDTMTGNLSVAGASYPKLFIRDTTNGSVGQIQHFNHLLQIIATEAGSTSNSRQIMLSDKVNKSSLSDALRLAETKDGVSTYYNILHTGNLSDVNLARIRTVEYTGTGTKSVSAAVGFVPKLVVVQQVLSVSSSDSPSTLPLVFNGVGQAMGLYQNGSSGDLEGFEINVTAFGETVSWNGTDYVEANNKLNTTYRVTAIG
ncbi:hypothetical protein [Dysosmobacter sp.]|uniref:hypothetical protein n=1 Tax=Dysosmobacter sp. TaxID=2591382 RepID=UPI002A84B478|nr:hypothetical protein [Dysosmobacter sp.]MDY3281698.1 hypothetical protein [Dysosmobacter sp.]